MSTLLVPEHLLAETISIIEIGLIHSQPITMEVEDMLEQWCADKTAYLEELASMEDD